MAENQLGGQQVLLLPEGATRLLGRDAQRTNIAVAVAVAGAVKTTLGPKGMDKMMVSDLGDVVITNDGATILEEMNVEHPVAKIMVDIAKTQDKEVGDGTTTRGNNGRRAPEGCGRPAGAGHTPDNHRHAATRWLRKRQGDT